MALSDELEALAKRHGALSYRNRADTQNPAFGFSVEGMESLLAEVRKQDDALILQLAEFLEWYTQPLCMCFAGCENCEKPAPDAQALLTAARARLEGKP